MKWGLYALLLLLCFCVQSSPSLFAVGGIKPVMVLPVAVSVALHESEVPAGVFGLITGLLWDFSAGKLFGFYGMIFFVAAVCITLLSMYFTKVNVLNAILFTAVLLLLCNGWNFLFYYLIWNYDSLGLQISRLLFTDLYTLLFAPPIFWAVRWIVGKFGGVVRA